MTYWVTSKNARCLQEHGLMEEPPAPSHISRCTKAPAPGSFTTPATKTRLVFWKEHVYPQPSTRPKKSSPAPLTLAEPLLSFPPRSRHPHTSSSLHVEANTSLGWVQPFIFSPLGSQFSKRAAAGSPGRTGLVSPVAQLLWAQLPGLQGSSQIWPTCKALVRTPEKTVRESHTSQGKRWHGWDGPAPTSGVQREKHQCRKLRGQPGHWKHHWGSPSQVWWRWTFPTSQQTPSRCLVVAGEHLTAWHRSSQVSANRHIF